MVDLEEMVIRVPSALPPPCSKNMLRECPFGQASILENTVASFILGLPLWLSW